MRRDPLLLSRRAWLVGAAASIGCGAAAADAPNGALVGAAASQHWSVRYAGVAPEAMFVRRADLPSRQTEFFWAGFLDDNIVGVPGRARQTEAFWYPPGFGLTVLRGVPPDSFPNGNVFALVGRAQSGVVQYGPRYPGDLGLLGLPGGMWIYGSAAPMARLAEDLAVNPRPPPDSALEPWAGCVQQDVGHDHLERKGMLPLGLLGREAVLARTVAAAQSTVVKFHFQTAAQARDAATSVRQLLASGAARDTRWSAGHEYYSRPSPLYHFMQNARDATTEGTAVVLLG